MLKFQFNRRDNIRWLFCWNFGLLEALWLIRCSCHRYLRYAHISRYAHFGQNGANLVKTCVLASSKKWSFDCEKCLSLSCSPFQILKYMLKLVLRKPKTTSAALQGLLLQELESSPFRLTSARFARLTRVPLGEALRASLRWNEWKVL